MNLHSNLKLKINFLKLRSSKTILDRMIKFMSNKLYLPYLLMSGNKNHFVIYLRRKKALEMYSGRPAGRPGCPVCKALITFKPTNLEL